MPFDPVIGGLTPDVANAGRLKWNAMTDELDSRLSVVEGIYPSPEIFESTQDAISNTTSFSDTNVGFPVESGKPYNFFAMLVWGSEDPFEDSPNLPPGYIQSARFSVVGPGSTPSPVSWLHYLLMWSSGGGGYNVSAYSEYDIADEITIEGYPQPVGSETGDQIALYHGFVQPPSGASGLFKFRFKSVFDQDNGIVVRAGSTVEVW
jgi:hypothetical protein